MSIYDVKAGVALRGLKVLDLGQSGTVLLVSRYLADYGATVIWVESKTHPDVTRVIGPFLGGKVDPNRGTISAITGASKFSVGINIRHPKGAELARRLAAWADVITFSYPAGVLEKHGLGYEDLRKVNPSAIIFALSAVGRTGPYKDLTAFGWVQEGISGLIDLLGWPDRKGDVLPIAYPDFSVPWLLTSMIMATLEYRRRTGLGQYIEASQLEAFLSYIPSHLLLQYTSNKEIPVRMGNRSPGSVPHAAYPCKGNDRWCVISINTDKEWYALCSAMGNPSWASQARFVTFLERKKNEDELDNLIASWTIDFEPWELAERLQAAGIAAGPVSTYNEILEKDAQLKHRKVFFKLSRPGLENITYWAYPARMSKTPAVVRPVPRMGQHTEVICREVLGLHDEEFVKLLTEGVLEIDEV